MNQTGAVRLKKQFSNKQNAIRGSLKREQTNNIERQKTKRHKDKKRQKDKKYQLSIKVFSRAVWLQISMTFLNSTK